MIYEMLNREMIFPHLEAASFEEVLRKLGEAAVTAGYAKATYADALVEREKEYPTALDVNGYGVAIPHTPVEHVLDTVIPVAILQEPVEFIQMGTDDEPVGVRIIFMLTLAGRPGEHDHLDQLQRIVSIIQDTSVLERLMAARDAEEIMNIVKEKESLL